MKNIWYILCVLCVLTSCANEKSAAPKMGRILVQSATQTNELPTASTPLIIENMQYSSFKNTIFKKNMGDSLSDKLANDLPTPLVDNSIIYTIDANLSVRATDFSSKKTIFKNRLTALHSAPRPIGFAKNNQALFIATNTGALFALDLKGNILWQIDTKSPLRSQITLDNSILYITSANNKMLAIDTLTGKTLWSYQHTPTKTNYAILAAPILHNNTIIVPFTTGDVLAFDKTTGVQQFAIDLTAPKTSQSQITANLIIDKKTLYIFGNETLGAFNIENGTPLFTQSIPTSITPLISGNAIFLIDNNSILYALNKQNGELFYKTPLKSAQENTRFHSPILLNNALFITSTTGDFITIDAKTGAIVSQKEKQQLNNTPIIHQNHMILYTNDADIIIYN